MSHDYTLIGLLVFTIGVGGYVFVALGQALGNWLLRKYGGK